MKTALKWFAIFMGVIVLLGVISLIFESDEDRAARESKLEQDKIAADQDKADKLRAEADKKASQEKAVGFKSRSGIPNLGGKSEPELLTDCQIDIQNKLSNPRSMDIISSNLKYKKEANHELWFQFYAKNQFNAESKHTGMCEFDDDGNLLSSKFE